MDDGDSDSLPDFEAYDVYTGNVDSVAPRPQPLPLEQEEVVDFGGGTSDEDVVNDDEDEDDGELSAPEGPPRAAVEVLRPALRVQIQKPPTPPAPVHVPLGHSQSVVKAVGSSGKTNNDKSDTDKNCTADSGRAEPSNIGNSSNDDRPSNPDKPDAADANRSHNPNDEDAPVGSTSHPTATWITFNEGNQPWRRSRSRSPALVCNNDTKPGLKLPPPPPPPVPLDREQRLRQQRPRLPPELLELRHSVCFRSLMGRCWYGDACTWKHPDEKTADLLRKYFGHIPCHFGGKCYEKGCIFWHEEVEDDAEDEGPADEERRPSSRRTSRGRRIRVDRDHDRDDDSRSTSPPMKAKNAQVGLGSNGGDRPEGRARLVHNRLCYDSGARRGDRLRLGLRLQSRSLSLSMHDDQQQQQQQQQNRPRGPRAREEARSRSRGTKKQAVDSEPRVQLLPNRSLKKAKQRGNGSTRLLRRKSDCRLVGRVALRPVAPNDDDEEANQDTHVRSNIAGHASANDASRSRSHHLLRRRSRKTRGKVETQASQQVKLTSRAKANNPEAPSNSPEATAAKRMRTANNSNNHNKATNTRSNTAAEADKEDHFPTVPEEDDVLQRLLLQPSEDSSDDGELPDPGELSEASFCTECPPDTPARGAQSENREGASCSTSATGAGLEEDGGIIPSLLSSSSSSGSSPTAKLLSSSSSESCSESCSDLALDLDSESKSCSDSESSESDGDEVVVIDDREPYLPQKEEPFIIMDTPDLAVVFKPAGWLSFDSDDTVNQLSDATATTHENQSQTQVTRSQTDSAAATGEAVDTTNDQSSKSNTSHDMTHGNGNNGSSSNNNNNSNSHNIKSNRNSDTSNSNSNGATNTSSFHSVETLLKSGFAEPLSKHPVVQQKHPRHVVMGPPPLISGWTLIARTEEARSRFLEEVKERRVISYSLALVEGAVEASRPGSMAASLEGTLEVSVLMQLTESKENEKVKEAALVEVGAAFAEPILYGKDADVDVDMTEADPTMEKKKLYTLLLLKATGNACGCENALLKLAWRAPVLGHPEHEVPFGYPRPDCIAAGRPFLHIYAMGFCNSLTTCPLPSDLRQWLSSFEGAGGLTLEVSPADISKRRELIPSEEAVMASERLREVLEVWGQMPPELLSVPPEQVLATADAIFRLPPPPPQQFPSGILAPPPPPRPHCYDFDPVEVGLPKMTNISKQQWLVQALIMLLKEAQSLRLQSSVAGEVSLPSLLHRFPQLRDACYGRVKVVAQAILADRSKALELLGTEKEVFVRLRPPLDRLQAFVETYCASREPGTYVSVAELLANRYIEKLYSSAQLPCRPILALVKSCHLFDVDSGAEGLTLRPLLDRVRIKLQDLLKDPDPLLASKIHQTGGEVPLEWMLQQYDKQLTGGNGSLALQPREAAVALKDADESAFAFDRETLIIRPAARKEEATGSSSSPSFSAADTSAATTTTATTTTTSTTPTTSTTTATSTTTTSSMPRLLEQSLKPCSAWNRQWSAADASKRHHPSKLWVSDKEVQLFRAHLEFYFQPFNLQYNRLLLHSAIVDSEMQTWRWSIQRLAHQVPRIGTIYLALKDAGKRSFLNKVFATPSKYVSLVSLPTGSCDDKLEVELKYPPDFRFPTLISGAPAWVRGHFLSPRHSMPQLPSSASVLLSYCIGRCSWAAELSKLEYQRWQNKILRQVTAYFPDIICLQDCPAFLGLSADNASRGSVPASSHGRWTSGRCHSSSSNANNSNHNNDNAKDNDKDADTANVSSHRILALREATKASQQGGGDGSLLSLLLPALAQEGFDWCANRLPNMSEVAPPPGSSGPEDEPMTTQQSFANVICWRRNRWKAQRWCALEHGSLLAILEPQDQARKSCTSTSGRGENVPWAFAVGCCSSQEGQVSGHQLLSPFQGKLLVPAALCGNFSQQQQQHSQQHLQQSEPLQMVKSSLGRGFRSAYKEVLGSDMSWTSIPDASSPSQGPSAPDALLLRGGPLLTPWASLSGPNRPCPSGPRLDPATKDERPDFWEFPTEHLPLVVALEHTPFGAPLESESKPDLPLPPPPPPPPPRKAYCF